MTNQTKSWRLVPDDPTPELLAFVSDAIGLSVDQRRRNHEGE